MTQVFTRGGSAEEFTVDITDVVHESVSIAVVRVVSAYVGTEIEEMPPIENTIAPDALDELTEQALHDPEVKQTEVTFHYHGVRVTISSTGEMRLRITESSS